MVISPAQLVDEPLKLDETIAPGVIEYAPDIRQVGPLTVKGQAELIVEHRGPKEFVEDIRLRAMFSGRFEQLCARCLEPVEQNLEGTFDLIFRPGVSIMWPESTQLRKMRRKSGIMNRAACCWRTPCASRCF